MKILSILAILCRIHWLSKFTLSSIYITLTKVSEINTLMCFRNRNENLRDDLFELKDKFAQIKTENEELRSMLKLGERKTIERRGMSNSHRS